MATYHYQMIDRSNAVNLARNIEQNPHLKVTSIGVLGLASAVLAMDEELKRLYQMAAIDQQDR